MGGEGSGRRPDPVKALTPIARTPPPDSFIIPDFDGVAQHEATLEKFDARYSGTGTGVNYWVSGSSWLYPQSTSQGISGSYIFAQNTVSGSYIEGDGSRLRNLPAGSGGSLWTSGGNFLYPLSGQNVSGSGFITAGSISGSNVFTTNYDVDTELTDVNDDITTNANNITGLSGSVSANTTGIAGNDADITGLSGSVTANTGDITGLSGSVSANTTDIVGVSGAATLWLTDRPGLSGAASLWATDKPGISGSASLYPTDKAGLSGSIAANTTHRNDNTQAHSDYLLNNASDTTTGTLTAGGFTTTATISGANIFNTGDHNTSGSAYVVGVIMDPSATPPTASNFPQGTIYLQYTA